MNKKTAIQMKDQTFNGYDPVSIVTFLEDFKSACNTWNIYERAVICLFKNYNQTSWIRHQDTCPATNGDRQSTGGVPNVVLCDG